MSLDSGYRKRLKRREVPGGPRYITFSTDLRQPLFVDDTARAMFVDALSAARDRFDLRLIAWVLMPEHVHLLVVPSRSALDRALLSMKLASAQRLIHAWRTDGDRRLANIIRSDGTLRLWQKGGGFDRNVRDEGELTRAIRYIHRNPVDRGLVARPEDWAWSSLRWWLKRTDAVLRGDYPPGDIDGWAAWRGFV